MSNELQNKQAYPGEVEKQSASGWYTEKEPGMTLLEHYAGLAMQGILAKSGALFDEYIPEQASNAVKYAKALIAELEKENI